MRLLKTKRCQLIEAKDIPTPFPEYAILSHTWISPKDEITYQDFKQRKSDIENDVFKQKGWAKLQKYCDRAARDGWDWAWMDTCCIDKTNPSDTQEAINAMFRWYQNSGICYAFLGDVCIEENVDCADLDHSNVVCNNSIADSESRIQKDSGKGLINSNWFKRGWTLQELLAPSYLVFVDHAWRWMGTRESWADEIREASCIEARHLTDFSPTDYESCSIAMRLSWASGRHTTVEEDETYSLLGLFGISLPLIYGEGRWRAFNRLQRELITVYNDDSIFAWKSQQSHLQDKAHAHGKGILAPSIREYSSAFDVKSYGFYGNSFSMTNKGLVIHAERMRSKDGQQKCLIRLNCGLGDSKCLAIPLERVEDTYSRIQLDTLYEWPENEGDEWEEELDKQPTIIRANNHLNVPMLFPVFELDYPREIQIGKKYFVDFNTSALDTRLEPLDETCAKHELAENEIVLEHNRLHFINIGLNNGASESHFDVIINLNRKSFPSVGILARDKAPWERLEDPLKEASRTYGNLANYLHYRVATKPAYPATATDDKTNAVVGVSLLPRPRKQRKFHQPADEVSSASLKEYVVKIIVQQNGGNGPPVPERSNKRKRD